MPLHRGAVYWARVPLTERGGGGPADLEKFIIVLQSPDEMDENATQFAFVVASTDRTGEAGPRAFEVKLDERDYFEHATIVDGRWVYTLERERLERAAFLFTVSEERMAEISLAIFIGLQLTLDAAP